MSVATARARLLALQEETWRLYIDLDRQHGGSAVYDEGIGGVREPGFLASMLDAHTWITERVGEPFSLEDYVELQARVTAHAPADERWRPDRCWVHVPRAAIESGLDALWKPLGAYIDEAAAGKPGFVRIVMRLHAGDPERIAAEVARSLEEGGRALRAAAPEERLLAVARLHQRLELLHATRDANTRRHLVLLQRLLAEADLPPCLLTEPNHVYARSTESWGRCIRDGIHRWRAVTHALQRGLDVPSVLTEFDIRHRPTGCALGRWHKPEQEHTHWLA